MKHISTRWRSVLELDSQRRVSAGTSEDLAAAVCRGADLRIYTEFRHNEHIDVYSPSNERIQEVAEFAVTYLLDGRWAAGIMNLRQPISLPEGFGLRPSMSFFLYNQDGSQAVARPYLDGRPASGQRGASPPAIEPDMPKYHTHNSWDSGTNAPSSNFVYDFDVYRFFVRDDWTEVLAHEADGAVTSGSPTVLAEAVARGCSVKVGIRDLCASLTASDCPEHEIFVQVGSCYFYSDQGLMVAGSHPLIRVKAGIPMRYESGGWDFGWLMLRSDGYVVYRRCDPYSLAFEDVPGHFAVRWFVR